MSGTFNKRGRQKDNATFIRHVGPTPHLLTGFSLTDGGKHIVAAGPRLIFNLTFLLISV